MPLEANWIVRILFHSHRSKGIDWRYTSHSLIWIFEHPHSHILVVWNAVNPVSPKSSQHPTCLPRWKVKSHFYLDVNSLKLGQPKSGFKWLYLFIGVQPFASFFSFFTLRHSFSVQFSSTSGKPSKSKSSAQRWPFPEKPVRHWKAKKI